MDITLNQGYPDFVGQRAIFCGSAPGPSSYTTGGETLNVALFNFYIDCVDSSGAISVSGTYWGRAIPSATGARATWKWKIYAVGSFTEVSAATNLSAEKFVISGKGGLY